MFVNKQDYLTTAGLMAENKGSGFPNVLFVIAPPGSGVIFTLHESFPEFIDLDRLVHGGMSPDTATLVEDDKLYVFRVGHEADLEVFGGKLRDRAFIFEAKFDFSAAH